MAEVTLKEFLNNDSTVKAARKKLTGASAELTKLKNSLAAASGRISDAQRAELQSRIDAAQAVYDEAKKLATAAEADRTTFFNANQTKIQEKATGKEVSKAKQELENVLALKQQYPSQAAVLDVRIADLNDQINRTGKYAPKPPKITEEEVVGDQSKNAAVRDYTAEITGASKLIRGLSSQAKLDLSQVLKSAGYSVNPTSIYTDELVNAYTKALVDNQARSTNWGEEVPWKQFIQDKINEAKITGTGTGGSKGPSGTVSISTPLEAANKVEDIFKAELNRLPTPEERTKYANKLIAEEKKTSSITKATARKIGGIDVTEYTGGLDKNQFLTDLVRQLPEFSSKKSQAKALNKQELAKTVAANGFDLEKDFANNIDDWLSRIENGEKIDNIKMAIRENAKLGLPDNVKKLLDQGIDLDTVYSPYKRIMSNVLELTPDSIKLDDPVLRSAIGPDKEMTVYDFQNSLRKDPRWQFTANAHDTVSSAVQNVLKDFGFMG